MTGPAIMFLTSLGWLYFYDFTHGKYEHRTNLALSTVAGLLSLGIEYLFAR